MTNTPPRDTADDEIDLNALLGRLLDHRWLIAGVTGAFFVIAVAYAILATPIYQANGLVQVEQKVPDLPGLSAITQTLGASNSEATTEVAIIESRSVIGAAVEHLNLDVAVKPHRFPLIGGFIARHFAPTRPDAVAAPWLGIARDDWGGSKLDVFQLKVPTNLLGKELTLIAGKSGAYTLEYDGDDLLHGQVGQVAEGHGVTMQVQTLTANPGMRFSVTRNRTLTTILRLQNEVTASEQGKDSGIIQLLYENADPKRAVAVLDQVERAYVLQNVEKNSAQAASSLKFVEQQLPAVREHLDQAQAALNAFQTEAHSVDVTLQTKALLDQVVAVDGGIQQLKVQQADVARRFTTKHPAYIALMQQIGSLEAQKNKIEAQIDNLPDTQKQLLRLTEDVQVSNTTYTSLLNQAQQLKIAQAGTVGNVRVVDTAAALPRAVRPRKALVVVVVTFLGAFLSVAFVFLRATLNRGVEDPADIEKLGLPVYAAIPLSQRQLQILPPDHHRHGDARQHLLVVDTPADLAVEALRSLRTSLHFARLEADSNVLMLSGSGPSAGKTFVAANLGAVMAQAGQRVLLIDADLRKGGLHRVLGGRAEGGLSELISGQIDVETACRDVEGVQGLRFIARGKIPPNPSELLMHPAFKDLLTKLRGAYDMVIVDTPPILAVTDAAVVGQHAGICLLVVRFGTNQEREIALAKQRFEQNGVKIKGAVFNAVQKRASGYYSYGYYEYGASK
jgi:tyrosine-protein kinase Etk/Wzc